MQKKLAKRDNPVRAVTSGPLLDLKRVRQFIVLAETLNFRRAAERLHMAQPPLSVSIQKLEAQLETRLFERGGAGGVSLTPAGSATLTEARRLLFHNDQLLAAVRAVSKGVGGTLRIGFVGSTTHGVLQKIVRQFRAEFPAIELVLKEGTSVRIAGYIESGELDVGLIRTPLMVATRAQITPLLAETFIVAMPLGNSLSQKSNLRLEDLSEESFVFYAHGDSIGLRAMTMLACQHAGFMPHITQEATQVQTVISLVESGLGVALVPSIVRSSQSSHVIYRSLVDISSAADTGLALIGPNADNPAALHFQHIARRCFASE